MKYHTRGSATGCKCPVTHCGGRLDGGKGNAAALGSRAAAGQSWPRGSTALALATQQCRPAGPSALCCAASPAPAPARHPNAAYIHAPVHESNMEQRGKQQVVDVLPHAHEVSCALMMFEVLTWCWKLSGSAMLAGSHGRLPFSFFLTGDPATTAGACPKISQATCPLPGRTNLHPVSTCCSCNTQCMLRGCHVTDTSRPGLSLNACLATRRHDANARTLQYCTKPCNR